ncbi:MAG: DUF6683 family protein [Lysobacteraceae bacterium]
MRRPIPYALILACTLSAALASPARAFDNMADTSINNMMLGTHIPPMNRAMMMGVLDDSDDARTRSGLDADRLSGTPQRPPGLPLAMQRGGSTELARTQESLAQAMTVDEAGRRQLLEAFRSGQVAAQFGEQLRHNRMDPDDLADALTAWIVIMWLIANDQLDGRSDPARLQAVADQLGPLFRSNAELRGLSPQQRAAEFERVAALSMYGIAAYMKFQQERDRSGMSTLRAAVTEAMRDMGWDLTSFDITRNGLEPRR